MYQQAAPIENRNIPRAVVLTLGNKVVLYCMFQKQKTYNLFAVNKQLYKYQVVMFFPYRWH